MKYNNLTLNDEINATAVLTYEFVNTQRKSRNNRQIGLEASVKLLCEFDFLTLPISSQLSRVLNASCQRLYRRFQVQVRVIASYRWHHGSGSHHSFVQNIEIYLDKIPVGYYEI